MSSKSEASKSSVDRSSDNVEHALGEDAVSFLSFDIHNINDLSNTSG